MSDFTIFKVDGKCIEEAGVAALNCLWLKFCLLRSIESAIVNGAHTFGGEVSLPTTYDAGFFVVRRGD